MTYLNGLIFLILWSVCSFVYAEDLIEILDESVKSDPTYLSAEANFDSLKEIFPQAIANVLPNLSLSANAATNRSDIVGVTGGSNALIQMGGNSFGTNGYAITLTQPLFNFAYFMQLKQANAQVKQALVNYVAAGQDLIVRVVQSYFDVLLAEDKVEFAKANKDALAKALSEAKARYQTGLETMTGVYEAQAAYDSSVSNEIAEKNNLENTKESLRQLTGHAVEDVASLNSKRFKLSMPNPLNVEAWIQRANQQNTNLQAARLGMISARQQMKVNFAGHLPTLNMVSSYTRQNGDFFGTINYGQSAVGVQLQVPLFSGGQVNSQVRQAKYQYIQAGDQVEKAYRDALVRTRQLFNDVMTDISKVKADQQAVVSNQSSWQSTEASYQEGTRTMADVLLTISNLYQAKQNLAQDTYRYIQDTILLKQEIGSVSRKDIVALNKWLKGEAHVSR